MENGKCIPLSKIPVVSSSRQVLGRFLVSTKLLLSVSAFISTLLLFLQNFRVDPHPLTHAINNFFNKCRQWKKNGDLKLDRFIKNSLNLQVTKPVRRAVKRWSETVFSRYRMWKWAVPKASRLFKNE